MSNVTGQEFRRSQVEYYFPEVIPAQTSLALRSLRFIESRSSKLVGK